MRSFRAILLSVGFIFTASVSWAVDSDTVLWEDEIKTLILNTATVAAVSDVSFCQSEEALGAAPSVAQDTSSIPTHSHYFWGEYCDCGVCQYLESFIDDELSKRYPGLASHYVANTKSIYTLKEVLDAVMSLTK